MEITEVKVRLWDDKRLRALVTVVFDNCFVVRNIKVIEGRDEKLFVAMPSRRLSNGTYSDLAHPINREFRHEMESKILNAYLEELDLARDDPDYVMRSISQHDDDGDDPEPSPPEPRRWFSKR